ncbi:GNAT family N-acetyltransferase [Xenorhabdus stockiae]|uniref:GNAT family N-acetyltransferase n=1 Tax=Xenorhabdus stockiae TaxID=351614 RepID=UPI003CEEE5C1
MKIKIRSAETEDAEHFQRIFGHPDVYFYTLQRPCPSLEMWRERLKNNREQGVFDFVAEIDSNVVGTLGLYSYPNPRRKHVISLGIGIDPDYSGRGIGSEMMAFAIDYVFNWLGCIRIDLEVFTDNEKAIALYTKFGFEMEGIQRKAALKQGRYCDVMDMSLINEPIL